MTVFVAILANIYFKLVCLKIAKCVYRRNVGYCTNINTCLYANYGYSCMSLTTFSAWDIKQINVKILSFIEQQAISFSLTYT